MEASDFHAFPQIEISDNHNPWGLKSLLLLFIQGKNQYNVKEI